jgi:hypothetical protein
MQDNRLDSTFTGAASVETALPAAGCIGEAEPYVVVPVVRVPVVTVGATQVGWVIVPRATPVHPVGASMPVDLYFGIGKFHTSLVSALSANKA